MDQRLFYILNGNNGATYILNTRNWNSITTSLEFYKARSLKATVLKEGLRIFLMFSGNLCLKKLKSTQEIAEYLQTRFNLQTGEVSDNCSVLISPTQDKVIIHRHGAYYYKIAYKESYTKVRNEGNIYKALQRTKSFKVSTFFEEKEVPGNYYSFKMGVPKHEAGNKSRSPNLVNALVEFFQIANNPKTTLSPSVKKVLCDIENENLKYDVSVLRNILEIKQLTFPVGLIHRDFKPWNIKKGKQLLIYDFEETIRDGLPLEDLFNYHTDPIIRYKKTEDVVNFIFKEKHLNQYKKYLGKLNIEIEFEIFLLLYAWNRRMFWKENGETFTMAKYEDLFRALTIKLAGI